MGLSNLLETKDGINKKICNSGELHKKKKHKGTKRALTPKAEKMTEPL